MYRFFKQPTWLARGVIGISALFLLHNASFAQAKPPVKMGAILSLSGPAAAFGIPMRDGVVAAVEEVNKQGGIDGRQVEIVFIDDKTDPGEAAKAATQLINRDRVITIIGPGTGGSVMAVGPIAERAKVPLVSPSATIAIIDKKSQFYPWIFRSSTSDDVNVRAILSFMARQGAKRIAVFHQEDAYGKTGLDVARVYAKQSNLEIVAVASAPYSATDLGAQATRLREAKVDAVLMQSSIPAIGSAFLKAAKSVGLTAPIYANSGLAQKAFVDSAGPVAEGLRILSYGNIVYEPTPSEKKLVVILNAKGMKPTGWGELVGADAVMAAVLAARQLKGAELNGQAMRDSLERLCDFDSFARGKACYSVEDHNGRGLESVVITEISNGQMKSHR